MVVVPPGPVAPHDVAVEVPAVALLSLGYTNGRRLQVIEPGRNNSPRPSYRGTAAAAVARELTGATVRTLDPSLTYLVELAREFGSVGTSDAAVFQVSDDVANAVASPSDSASLVPTGRGSSTLIIHRPQRLEVIDPTVSGPQPGLSSSCQRHLESCATPCDRAELG
jgi:hypothetical protein